MSRWQPGTFVVTAFVSVLLVSCGTPPEAKPVSHSPPLHQGPLTDYVPAAGLRWMIVCHPRVLLTNAWLARAVAQLIPEDRWQIFALRTAIDPRTLSSAVIGGFDFSEIYIADLEGSGLEIEQRFREQLLSAVEPKASHPHVHRIVGVVGTTPRTLVRVDELFAAFIHGDASLARVTEGYALGRLSRSPTALRGAALSPLPAQLAQKPVQFYALGPFQGEWRQGARGLLGATTALGAAAVPLGDVLRVELHLHGAWSAAEDLPRLEQAWEDLQSSALGKLLGLERPARPPTFSLTGQHLTLEVELSLGPLLDGLRAAIIADVWEIMGVSPKKEQR